MKYYFVLFFIVAEFQLINAQQENSQWCFGDSLGIDWRNPENPEFYKTSQNTRGSCSSIADSSGNLLFYVGQKKNSFGDCPALFDTIGGFNRVFNRNHEIMDNGNCIAGDGWYNQHIILPMPDNDSLFYVFTSMSSIYPGISYSLIDIKANEGLGRVVERDHYLIDWFDYGFGGFTSICIKAMRHANGRDWWFINKMSKDAGSIDSLQINYLIFLVTPQGITLTPREAEGDSYTGFVELVFNKLGTKLYSISGDSQIDSYDFNRCTGEMTNHLEIQAKTIPYSNIYLFAELSPSGRYLYVSDIYGNCLETDEYELLQLDLLNPNPYSTRQIVTIVGPVINNLITFPTAGGLRLAPDGKIYFSTGVSSCYEDLWPYPDTLYNQWNMNLSVINNPDSAYPACNFTEYSFPLGGYRTYYSLPNMPNYNLGALPDSVCDSTIINISETKKFLKTNFNIFPNPCFYNCTLEYKPAKAPGNIAISNMQGKVVFTEKNIPVTLLQHGYEVNTSAFAKGVYTVTLVTGGEVVTKRLVKL